MQLSRLYVPYGGGRLVVKPVGRRVRLKNCKCYFLPRVRFLFSRSFLIPRLICASHGHALVAAALLREQTFVEESRVKPSRMNISAINNGEGGIDRDGLRFAK